MDPPRVSNIMDPMHDPQALVYTGHMMPGSGLSAPAQRAAEAVLVPKVDRFLAQHGGGPAFGSLACGSDIVIAERILAHGGELHVVLPMRMDDFLSHSVDPGDPEPLDGRRWRDRFGACLARAKSMTFSYCGSLDRVDRDATIYSAFHYAMGLALLRADEHAGAVHLLAVYDSGAADNIAGTAMAVRTWSSAGLPATLLDCPWRRGNPGEDVAVDLPYRPVLLAWLVPSGARSRPGGKAAAAPHEDRPERAVEAAIERLQATIADLASTDGSIVRLTGRERSRMELAVVMTDVESARTLADHLVRQPPAGTGKLRVVCDYGLVLDRHGRPDAELLKLLAGSEIGFDAPVGVPIATGPFAAEARIAASGRFRFRAMGSSRLTGCTEAEREPAPSILLFALEPRSTAST